MTRRKSRLFSDSVDPNVFLLLICACKGYNKMIFSYMFIPLLCVFFVNIGKSFSGKQHVISKLTIITDRQTERQVTSMMPKSLCMLSFITVIKYLERMRGSQVQKQNKYNLEERKTYVYIHMYMNYLLCVIYLCDNEKVEGNLFILKVATAQVLSKSTIFTVNVLPIFKTEI